MADIVQVWSEALPEVRNGVTGVGVWTALNATKPVIFEEGTFVLGLPHGETELSGHLKLPQTKHLIERIIGRALGDGTKVRIIEGVSLTDWETVKRRDAEARRLEELAMQRSRSELDSRTSWDTVYEQLSRMYSATPNRSMPHNRAKFLLEAIKLVADAHIKNPSRDEHSERNFARCIERVAQYGEVPSTIVAMRILDLTSGK